MQTRLQSKAINEKLANTQTTANVCHAKTDEQPSKPKLNNDILGVIKNKLIAKAKDDLSQETLYDVHWGGSRFGSNPAVRQMAYDLERPETEGFYPEIDFVDTGFETISNADFLVMHTPLLTDRRAADYKFNRLVDFLANVPGRAFKHVQFMAIPGEEKEWNNSEVRIKCTKFKGRNYVTSWQMVELLAWHKREGGTGRHYWRSEYRDLFDADLDEATGVNLYTDIPNSYTNLDC